MMPKSSAQLLPRKMPFGIIFMQTIERSFAYLHDMHFNLITIVTRA